MPYLVRLKRLPEGGPNVPGWRETVTAVATRDEEALAAVLRPLVRRHLRGLQWVDMMLNLAALPEAGGSVGPLPDGSTITVEPGPPQRTMRSNLREWGAPIDTLGSDDDHITAAWVAAFNAREGGGNVRRPVVAALNALHAREAS